MIKIILIAVCLFGCAAPLPIEGQLQLQSQPVVQLLKNERVDRDDGSYSFLYETSDGQTRKENAFVVETLDKGPVLVVTGSYSYIGPDSVTYKVHYVADDNGFRPQGDHIFKLPEVTTTTLPPPSGEVDPEILFLPPNAVKSLIG